MTLTKQEEEALDAYREGIVSGVLHSPGPAVVRHLLNIVDLLRAEAQDARDRERKTREIADAERKLSAELNQQCAALNVQVMKERERAAKVADRAEIYWRGMRAQAEESGEGARLHDLAQAKVIVAQQIARAIRAGVPDPQTARAPDVEVRPEDHSGKVRVDVRAPWTAEDAAAARRGARKQRPPPPA